MSTNQPLLNSLKSSSSLMWLAHSLEVLAIFAAVTGGINAYQATATGDYSFSSLGGVFIAAAIGVLLKGASGIISNAQFGQALNDLAHIGGGVIQSPLVVVHTNQPISSVQTPSVPVVSPPVQNSNPAQVSFQVSPPNPVLNQAISAQPIQPQVQHPSLDNVPLLNTLPNIAAIGK